MYAFIHSAIKPIGLSSSQSSLDEDDDDDEVVDDGVRSIEVLFSLTWPDGGSSSCGDCGGGGGGGRGYFEVAAGIKIGDENVSLC